MYQSYDEVLLVREVKRRPLNYVFGSFLLNAPLNPITIVRGSIVTFHHILKILEITETCIYLSRTTYMEHSVTNMKYTTQCFEYVEILCKTSHRIVLS